MKTQDLETKRWDDIVFEQRNKEYGAYIIRYVYAKHVVYALGVTIIIIALVLGFPHIMEWFKGTEHEEIVELKTVKYTDLAPPPPINKNTPPPPKLDIPPPVKTIIKFLPPKVTDKEIIEEEKMPTQEEVKQNDVGAESIEGTGEVIFDEPVQEVVGDGEDYDKVFTVVEQQAEFEGGIEAMYKFVAKNMRYPATARRMGVEGSVFVSFVVDKEGGISDVQVVKGISAECDKEAMRVIKMMAPWKPGKQNGRPVKSRFVLPIKFKLQT